MALRRGHPSVVCRRSGKGAWRGIGRGLRSRIRRGSGRASSLLPTAFVRRRRFELLLVRSTGAQSKPAAFAGPPVAFRPSSALAPHGGVTSRIFRTFGTDGFFIQ